MFKHMFPLALTAALLAGCVTTRTNQDDATEAKLGQTVNLGGPKVTPLAVLEDSRCPKEARCIWAGRVRLSVRVATGAGMRCGSWPATNPYKWPTENWSWPARCRRAAPSTRWSRATTGSR